MGGRSTRPPTNSGSGNSANDREPPSTADWSASVRESPERTRWPQFILRQSSEWLLAQRAVAGTKLPLGLRSATPSPCRACARHTKTVEGLCAQCWEPKKPGARVMWREPKRMPFFDLDIDPIWAYLSLTVALSVLMKLVWTLVSTL